VSIHHHEITLRGLRVHYAEAGEGPPLILVHGFLVSHKEWLPILPYLSQHFRCIAPDLPGWGKSDKRAPGEYPYTREAYAETLVELMGALDLSRAHILGHSMGGSIAITLAADHPEVVDRLSLIDTACYPFPVPMKGRLPLFPMLGPVIFKRLYGRSMFRDYFKNDVFAGHDTINLDRVDAYYEDFRSKPSREAAYEVLKRTIDLTPLVPKIPRVAASTLILWGAEDRLLPVGLAHRLVRELPEARLHILEGAAHAPNEEIPERTAELIVEHCSGADA